MSDYMSMNRQDADELARRGAARMLARKGYEIVEECFRSGGEAYLIARDGERGALAFVACRMVGEFAEECPVERAAFEAALVDWLSRGHCAEETKIRLDDVQFRPIEGAMALARHHVGALE